MLEALGNADWTYWVGGLAALLAAIAGVVLTVITLPGPWLPLLVGAALKLWHPDSIEWWILIVALVLALLGEAIEFLASAMGAAKFGATKKGAWAACAGSLIGAIVGAPFIFPIGSIVGSVLGAGVGAVVVERGIAKKEWADATRAGTGAALGRLAATVAKTSIAAIIGVMIAVDAFVPVR